LHPSQNDLEHGSQSMRDVFGLSIQLVEEDTRYLNAVVAGVLRCVLDAVNQFCRLARQA
jgi:hypothetical protein